MAAPMHLFSASAALMGASSLSFVCTECGTRSARPVDDIIHTYGEDCTLGEVVAGASCRNCGSPFIAATPDDDDD